MSNTTKAINYTNTITYHRICFTELFKKLLACLRANIVPTINTLHIQIVIHAVVEVSYVRRPHIVEPKLVEEDLGALFQILNMYILVIQLI